MKRISNLAPFLFAVPLAISFAACDLEKEDGADTGAVTEEEDLDEDAEDDGEGEGGGSSAGTSPEPDDTGDDDSDSGMETGDSDSDSDSDSDGDSDSDSDSGGSGGDADGIAMLHGELPDIDDGGETGSGGSGGGGESGIPEDALFVVLDSDGTATCEEPWGGPECGGNWRISFTLLPEHQVPGSYDLFDEASGFFGFSDVPYPEGDCAGGGGTLDGTLVIDAIDEDSISGHIEDADTFDFDANVSFVVPRC